jgi:hypothetical protein
MIQFLNKYKAFFIGLIIIIPIFYLLYYYGFLIIQEDGWYMIIPFVIFWGFVIALPIHHFNYLKTKKETVIKALSLFLLLIIILVIDSIMKLPDNPITFILIMGGNETRNELKRAL